MTHDPLNTETSFSVTLKETGVEAKAKSRTVAAFDRLGGNLADYLNIKLERGMSRERALISGEAEFIEAAVKAGIAEMKADPASAGRVITNYFETIFRRDAAKSGVLQQTVEQLRREPMTVKDATSGPLELDPLFLSKFERLAEDASTENLKEKWGRVLSAELKNPGTFSPKVLRLVDEIEPEVAARFEELCSSLLANVLPRSLVGELPFRDHVLDDAGLVLNPEAGSHIRKFVKIAQDGSDTWFLSLGEFGLSLRADANVPYGKTLVTTDEGDPAIRTYILTAAGFALSRILPNKRAEAFHRLFKIFDEEMPGGIVRPLAWNDATGLYDEITFEEDASDL